MISWAHPWTLVLLVPVMLLPLQPRWTGRLALKIPGPDMHEAPTTFRRVVASVPLLMRMLGLVLLVLALARPRISSRDVQQTSDGLDIMMAIDTSGSMRQEDLSTRLNPVTRLQVAKGVLGEFIEGRPYDRLGVVVFGEDAFTQVPLTLDHETLQSVLRQVEIGIAGERRTAVGTAIAVATKRLRELEAPSKILILLTDGRSNAGQLTPDEAAKIAATLDIKIYTIGVGRAQRGFFSLGGGDGLDEKTLTRIAEATGGRYFRATDARSLQRVYETIDELEPSPAEIDELTQHLELYPRVLIPGLLLLLVDLLLSSTWLRRWP